MDRDGWGKLEIHFGFNYYTNIRLHKTALAATPVAVRVPAAETELADCIIRMCAVDIRLATADGSREPGNSQVLKTSLM
jgi:hypothetical protein